MREVIHSNCHIQYGKVHCSEATRWIFNEISPFIVPKKGFPSIGIPRLDTLLPLLLNTSFFSMNILQSDARWLLALEHFTLQFQ